jgi:hypothetical protein
MCAVLLETFEASARQIGHRFTQDTWESILKVMMGICDHLLRLPELMTPLANMLCPLLIKVQSFSRDLTSYSYMLPYFICLVALYHLDSLTNSKQCYVG